MRSNDDKNASNLCTKVSGTSELSFSSVGIRRQIMSPFKECAMGRIFGATAPEPRILVALSIRHSMEEHSGLNAALSGKIR